MPLYKAANAETSCQSTAMMLLLPLLLPPDQCNAKQTTPGRNNALSTYRVLLPRLMRIISCWQSGDLLRWRTFTFLVWDLCTPCKSGSQTHQSMQTARQPNIGTTSASYRSRKPKKSLTTARHPNTKLKGTMTNAGCHAVTEKAIIRHYDPGEHGALDCEGSSAQAACY